ncbi:MAG: hypothetical protein GC154_18810 [bacterium]|nr:hypothetical protein [bacterium]
MNESGSTFSPSARVFITVSLAVYFIIAPLYPQNVDYAVAFAFRSIVFLVFALMMAQGGWGWAAEAFRRSPVMWPATAGVVGSSLSLFWTPSLYDALDSFTLMLTLYILWFVLLLMNFTPRERVRLAAALVTGGVIASMWALYSQWIGHAALIEALKNNPMYDDVMREEMIVSLRANRALGRFGNPNQLAGYLALCLWPAWWLWKRTPGAAARTALGMAACILLAGVYRSYSRSGLLLVVLSGAWLALYEWRSRGGRVSMKTASAVAGAALLGVAALALALPPGSFGGRLMTISTIVARTHFYRGALLTVRDHPFLGVGLNGFEGYYAQYLRPGDLEARYVHNVILETAVEGGVAGVLILLWMLTVLVVSLWRFRRGSGEASVWAAAGACAALFALSLVDFHNRLAEMWLVPLFMLSLVHPPVPAPDAIRSLSKALRAAAFAALAAAWVVLAGLRYAHDAAAEQGYYLFADGRLAEARRAGEWAVFFAPIDAEGWNRLAQIWMRIPTEQGRLNWLSCSKRAVRWAPRRASLRADYAEALFTLGYRDEALEQIERARRLFPARPRYCQQAAAYYRAMQKPDEADRLEAEARRIQTQIEERKI